MPCEFLSLEDLLDIVSALKIGPVRDLGLLNAAALRPQTTLMGQDAYPSTTAKAAALLESLTKNERTGRRQQAPCMGRLFCFLVSQRTDDPGNGL